MSPEEMSSMKVPKRVTEKAKMLLESVEKYGWQSLPPEQQVFFSNGITRGAIVEAALHVLEAQWQNNTVAAEEDPASE